MKQYYVYILANQKPVLYVGVTNDLVRRVYEHKNGLTGGFTKDYDVKKLVYFEVCNSIEEAIQREKCIKHWKRDWKLELIRKSNPKFEDLYDNITESDPRSSRG